MRIMSNRRGTFESFDTLSNAMELDCSGRPVISIVGAGGKTTVMMQLAFEQKALLRDVFVTTSTHIYEPTQYASVDANEETIIDKLKKEHLVIAGVRAKEGKIASLQEDTYLKVQMEADVTFVEADGSKRFPAKVPNAKEPVILGNTTDILIVMGLSSLNRTLRDGCHRSELAEEFLGKRDEDVLTEDDLVKIILLKYIKPLSEKYPQVKIRCVLNQADNEEKLIKAKHISESLVGVECIIRSDREE